MLKKEGVKERNLIKVISSRVLCLLLSLLAACFSFAQDLDSDGVPDTVDLDSSDPEVRMFHDVGATHDFKYFIEPLGYSGVTRGCGEGIFCPGSILTRGEMAVLLLRAVYGAAYRPPSNVEGRFDDVAASNPRASWIEQLARDGISNGCSATSFCPESAVTREQVAVFLLRSKHGWAYTPPERDSSSFQDVDKDHWASDWIEQLVTEGISSGCGSGNYCPSSPVTRAQFAKLLFRAFDLKQSYTTLANAKPIGFEIESDDGRNLYGIAGEITSHKVAVQKADSTIPTRLRLNSDVSAVSLVETGFGALIFVDSRELEPGYVGTLELTLENMVTGTVVSKEIVIELLEKELVGSGILSGSGDVVSSESGRFGIEIDSGQLSRPVGIEIYRVQKPRGQSAFIIRYDRDVSQETAKVVFHVDSGLTGETDVVPRQAPDTLVAPSADGTDKYAVSEHLEDYEGLYLGEVRVTSTPTELGDHARACEEAQSIEYQTNQTSTEAVSFSAVCPYEPGIASTLYRSQRTLSDKPHAPLLFVHGFTLGSDFGGGEKTWGHFPGRIEELTADSYMPLGAYEFRWRTNASFRVVADDLRRVIEKIHENANQPVRIVAHSFGGLLVRTLLQGRFKDQSSESSVFDENMVHSVMTLGTPHSGIFDKTTEDSSFPQGQDKGSGWFEGCGQVSCWEAGEETGLHNRDSTMVVAGSDTRVGGLVQDLASKIEQPVDIPLVVGIGLQRDTLFKNNRYSTGDDLISFDGQRYSPRQAVEQSGADRPGLLRCEYDAEDFGPVTEIVLGPLVSNGLTLGNPRPLGKPEEVENGKNGLAAGYAHNGFVNFASDDYTEAAVTNDSKFESHASLEIFKHFIGLRENSAYCMPGSTEFMTAQLVYVTENGVNAREEPNGAVLGQQDRRSSGRIIDGPESAGSHRWWKVNFDDGADGWIAEDYIESPAIDEVQDQRVLLLSESEGNWEILAAEIGGTAVVNLTQNEHDDVLPDYSPNRDRIAFTSDRQGSNDIYVMTNDGEQVTPLTDHGADDGFPVWSPNGKKLAFVSNRDDDDFEIYLMDANGNNKSRLTESKEADVLPAWSPDSRKIVFVSERDGNKEIYFIDLYAPRSIKNLTANDEASDDLPFFSPDGEWISFLSDRDGGYDLWIMGTDGSNPRKLTPEQNNEVGWYAWSPDGSKIAFDSRSDGDYEIYVIDVSHGEGSTLRQITDNTDNDQFADWSWDGSKILFISDRDGITRLYAADPDGGNQIPLSSDSSSIAPPMYSPIYQTGGGCFIATAAYGSYLEPEVMLFRNFRDRYLLTNRIGMAFTEKYYELSPAIAAVIKEHEALKWATRAALTPLALTLKYPVFAPTALIFLLIVFVFGRKFIESRVLLDGRTPG